jgi:hypothetical protein
MHAATLRTWTIRWLYGAIAAHLLVGAALPWLSDAPLLTGYHQGIESAFWTGTAPTAARSQQLWWMALFGATVQAAAVWMGGLAWIGDRHRNATAWGALIGGLLLWAPQDMLVSMRANCWEHVWVDAAALVAMLPPLFYLYFTDRKQKVT